MDHRGLSSFHGEVLLLLLLMTSFDGEVGRLEGLVLLVLLLLLVVGRVWLQVLRVVLGSVRVRRTLKFGWDLDFERRKNRDEEISHVGLREEL